MTTTAVRRQAGDLKGERGLTLIEVLVSFFILFVVTLAVLQLLSMAYLVNLGSMVRTELTYRAEQVVETIRLQRWRVNSNPLAADGCCPVGLNATKNITAGDCDAFWGPTGANVIHPDSVLDPNSNARYEIDYVIQNNTVTVRAIPATSGANPYLGPAATKEVVYVAQLP